MSASSPQHRFRKVMLVAGLGIALVAGAGVLAAKHWRVGPWRPALTIRARITCDGAEIADGGHCPARSHLALEVDEIDRRTHALLAVSSPCLPIATRWDPVEVSLSAPVSVPLDTRFAAGGTALFALLASESPIELKELPTRVFCESAFQPLAAMMKQRASEGTASRARFWRIHVDEAAEGAAEP